MFSNFTNPVWSGTATQVNNTDYSLSGTSRKITFNAVNDTAILSFDAVDISSYDEITMQVYFSDRLNIDTSDRLSITIGTDTFTITKDKIEPGWNHFLIDAVAYNSISSITFTGLSAGLIILVDLIGYRKADTDYDIVDALKNTISLNYGFSTTINAAITAGQSTISLTDHSYVFDRTRLTVTDGVNTETVNLNTRNKINETFTNAYAYGSAVTALCPVVGEDEAGEEPDPVCGIVINNVDTVMDDWSDKTLSGSKERDHFSELEILIYIECTSKLKVLDMKNQFNRSYGKEFTILLDGEVREMYLDNSVFNPGAADTYPRYSYFYKFKPQAQTISKRIDISTFNLTVEPKSA